MPPPPSPNLAAAAAALLEKKTTFLQGCKVLEEALSTPQVLEECSGQQIWDALRRVKTLLASRYTSPGFWSAGARLFRAAGHASLFSDEQCQQCLAWERETSSFLGGDESSTSAGEEPQRHLQGTGNLLQDLFSMQVLSIACHEA